MKFTRTRLWHLLPSLLGVVACVVCLLSEARGQGSSQHLDSAPPPIKYIPRDERAQLTAVRDLKPRLRLSLELADKRLTQATQLSDEGRFDQAAVELGIYAALIEDAVKALRDQAQRNKARDLYKRLELTLRAHDARLAVIRRITPSDYAGNVKDTIDHTKRMRTEALNSFFGETVVQDDLENDRGDVSLDERPNKTTSQSP